MKKEQIISEIKNVCLITTNVSLGASEEEFYAIQNQKWSAAQNYAHLTLSAKLLARAISAPKIALWLKFGRKFNNISRSYDDLANMYVEVNSKPREALTGFEPRMKAGTNKSDEILAFQKIHEKLLKALDSWSEKQLGSYLVPHPLMGKITFREMLYFMIYHIQHHKKAIEVSLKS